ncbi:conserved hypothetical protein [Vibrio coralliirubri]|uniref:nitroreductase family protein n=1 Tax=Vibrio coralliirubri TaxID=1516159 RepID=UPI0006334248|nr:nitroreductase family protein [Vibrio coralliirubri]CDT53455.1 conserved hypothetical protein [Vibrio coralliirubri]
MTTAQSVIRDRRSARVFVKNHDYDPNIISECLKLAHLAPNSSNLQLWEFHRVTTENKKALMKLACLNQSAAATSSELIVFVGTPQRWKASVEHHASRIAALPGYLENDDLAYAHRYFTKTVPFNYRNDRFGLMGLVRKLMNFTTGLFKPIPREVFRSDIRATIHKNNALAIMTFCLAMKEQGLDTCIMEGFDSVRVKKILGLDSESIITAVVACGKAAPEGIYGNRVRFPCPIFKH